MTDTRALTVSQSDYDAIEAAVMETARGRWFLHEYARRNRTADTEVLLDAIGRLEKVVTQERPAQDFDRVRFDLLEMAKAISKTKSEISALRPGEHAHSDLSVASEALDGIVRSTERATSEILEAAEHVQETAWTLREGGTDDALCSELDRRATEIYTACTFQDLTAQRIVKIVNTLRFLEARIAAMIEIWGGETETAGSSSDRPDLSGDLAAHEGLSQSDVDGVIIDEPADFPGHSRPKLDIVHSAPEPVVAEAIDEAEFAEEPRFSVTVFDDDLLFVDPSLGAVELTEPSEPRESKAAAEDGNDLDWAEAETAPPGRPGLDKPEALADVGEWSTHEKLARFS
jgi:hypothetical protein